MKYVNNALAKYGASYDYENGRIITKCGTPTRIKIEEKGKRLRMVSIPEGRLIFSGGKNEVSVCTFVEKFWFWEKLS